MKETSDGNSTQNGLDDTGEVGPGHLQPIHHSSASFPFHRQMAPSPDTIIPTRVPEQLGRHKSQGQKLEIITEDSADPAGSSAFLKDKMSNAREANPNSRRGQTIKEPVSPDTSSVIPKDEVIIRLNSSETQSNHWSSSTIKESRQRWVQAFACSLFFMNNWGLSSSFGVYQAYYQLPNASPSLSTQGHSPSTISWIGTTQAALTLIIGILSGPLFDKGFFYCIIVPASALMSGTFMALSVSTKYWHILLAQGVLQGVCSGMLYIPSIAIIPHYFNDRERGRALGLVTAGAPIGGMVYPIVFRSLIERHGFAWATRIVGFIVLGTLGGACLLLKPIVRPKEQVSLRSVGNMVKDAPYLSFLAAAFLLFCAMLVPYVFCATYSVTVIDGISMTTFYEDSDARNISLDAANSLSAVRDRAFYTVIILNGANFFGRLVPASLSDLGFPSEIMLGISTLVMGVLSFLWILITTRAWYTAFLVAYGFASGTLSTLPPIALRDLRPNTNLFATSIGIVYLCAGLGILVGTPVAALLNKYSSVSYPYLASQVWVGGFMFTGTVCVFYSGIYIQRRRRSRFVSNIGLFAIESPPT
ncbi:hypothetical protein KVT40_002443 [Elsinoe batatas]|uniref:Major facilitator superfamily (MFS) profile domain-containing protein n=1 Tax=Elsinoe batatas TaxID=2601811 RepID=A0A8K0PMA3_9PEZI|nr:hypothetical protein KVT40_002443 [Elsinoe batatas]